MRKTISILAILILLAGAAYFALQRHQPEPAASTAAAKTEAPAQADWPGNHLAPVPSGETLVPRNEVSEPKAEDPTHIQATVTSQDKPTEEPSEAVQQAVGPVEPSEYQQRLASVKSLGNRLSAADVACLMKYLADPATAREGNLWDLGIKNEALTVLLRQERMPSGMGAMLSGIVKNEAVDLTWRDYALQFVPVFAARTPGRPEAENAAIRSTVAAAMSADGTVLRGTALIAMERLAGETNLFTKQDVKDASRAILRGAKPGDPARITAIQTLGERGDAEALDEVRRIAHDASSPVLERMSAFAALGAMGEPEDLAWLRELNRQPALDKRLKTAVAYNEKQLAGRVERK